MTVFPPWIKLDTLSGMSPRVLERVEKAGADANSSWGTIAPYWSLTHRLQVFMNPKASVVGVQAGNWGQSSLFMGAPGIQTSVLWGPTPIRPLVIVGLRQYDATLAFPRQLALRTAYGDGVRGFFETVYPGTGVGAAWSQDLLYRVELFYKPGEYVAVSLNSVEVIRHSDPFYLPNPAFAIPAGSTINLAGVGVHSGTVGGDQQVGAFASLMIDTYLP